MDLKVRVLCRPELAPGFELAGLRVERIRAREDTLGRVRQLAKDPQIGILLIEDDLHQTLPPLLLERMDRAGQPIVAPFPSPRWDERALAEEYVLEILRRAVGYRVRPR